MTTTIRIGAREVPRVGLGTNRLQDTDEHAAFIREAIDAGIRHIDTARLYSGGHSESAIGAALASGRPDDLVVATKGGYHDSRPQTIAREIQESLRQLRTERIDLYYLHKVHDAASIEDSLGAIVRERDRGRICHIGVSNVDAAQLKRALAVTQIAAVQNHYNLAHREHDDVLELCAAQGIAFVPYFPLRGVTPAAREIAARHGVTPTQVALAWLLHRSPTTLPIPGTLSTKHVRENLGALDVKLDEEDLAALGALPQAA
ncbi:MAG: pyridoxine 4-dehydrogenase [Solirubrobacteraceae bacterium]|jgi:aryl-alcohol dehydrogenase-like predicted oxidoreductase|nr:pyridoxine 4-dehydrogenase [Solirubrobacteraceae bacterium]